MGKVSYKEKERQRRELEILEKTSQLLTERGYANLNMDELAEVVGVSKPTLYQHFKSKEELVTQVMLQHFQKMQQQFEQWTQDHSGSLVDRLKIIMRTFMHNRYKHGALMAITDQQTLWAVMHNNPQMIAYRQQGQAMLFELIDAAKTNGEIRADIPTPIIGRAFFCLQGAFMHHYGEPIVTEENLDEAIDSVIEIFLNGVNTNQGSNPGE